LALDVECYLRDEPIRARPVGKMEKLWRWGRRNPKLATVSGLAISALVALVVVSILFAISESNAAARLRLEAARIALDHGLALCEKGDVSQGILWLAHSAEIVPPDAIDLQREIRANLASWSPRVNPLSLSLQHENHVNTVAYSPDGKTIL